MLQKMFEAMRTSVVIEDQASDLDTLPPGSILG